MVVIAHDGHVCLQRSCHKHTHHQWLVTHLHEVLHGDWLLHVILTHLSDLSRRLAGNLAAHAVHGGITADVGDVITTAGGVSTIGRQESAAKHTDCAAQGWECE